MSKEEYDDGLETAKILRAIATASRRLGCMNAQHARSYERFNSLMSTMRRRHAQILREMKILDKLEDELVAKGVLTKSDGDR